MPALLQFERKIAIAHNELQKNERLRYPTAVRGR